MARTAADAAKGVILPAKDCAACGLPFTWRKKWARDWDNVQLLFGTVPPQQG